MNSLFRVIAEVKYQSDNGQLKTLGTAFILNHRKGYLVTCAHLFGPELTENTHPKDTIWIKFASDQQNHLYRAVIHKQGWFPYKLIDEDKVGDLAYLEIVDDKDLPQNLQSVILDVDDIDYEIKAQTFGYPEISPSVSGLLFNLTAWPIPPGEKFIRIDGENKRIQKGVSGAPVISVVTGKVVGIISLRKPSRDVDSMENLAFALPARWIWDKKPSDWDLPTDASPLKFLDSKLIEVSLDPIPIEPIWGREQLIADLFKQFTQATRNSLWITGEPGIGKTSLGAAIARKFGEKFGFQKVCWLELREGLEDLGAVSNYLVAFLKKTQETPRLETYLRTEPDSITISAVMLALKDDLLIEDYLLCFDNMQYITYNKHHGVLELFREIIKYANVVFLSRRNPPKMLGNLRPTIVSGLDVASFLEILKHESRPIPPDRILQAIRNKFGGNPLLFELFIGTPDNADVDGMIESFDNLPSVIPQQLYDKIFNTHWEKLSYKQRQIMKSLPVFRGTLNDRAIQVVSEQNRDRLISELRVLSNRHLIRYDPNKVFAHDIVKDFFAKIPANDEFRAMHSRAAEFFYPQGEFLEASYHYLKAKEFEKSAELLTEYFDTYLYDPATRRDLGRQVARIEIEELPVERQDLRAKVLLSRGRYYHLGLSHLDSIQYRIGLRARETHLEGDL